MSSLHRPLTYYLLCHFFLYVQKRDIYIEREKEREREREALVESLYVAFVNESLEATRRNVEQKAKVCSRCRCMYVWTGLWSL